MYSLKTNLISRGLTIDLEPIDSSPCSHTLEWAPSKSSHDTVFKGEWRVAGIAEENDETMANIALESQTRLHETVKHTRLKGRSIEQISAWRYGTMQSNCDTDFAQQLLSVAKGEKETLTDALRKEFLPQESIDSISSLQNDAEKNLQNVLIGKLLTIDESNGSIHEVVKNTSDRYVTDNRENVVIKETNQPGFVVPINDLIKSFSFSPFSPPATTRQQEEKVELSLLKPSAQSKEEDGGSTANEDIEALLQRAVSVTVSGTVSTPKKSVSAASTQVNGSITWASGALLSNVEYEALRPTMAFQYPFELDDFQKQAVMRLERRECVFVAAHTSAGKTVVAEYAIAMARRNGSRAVYTSPIKALSNQKYRDFRQKFGDDVGIITGDVSVNPDASCLIMTTEILRSMLYRGSDIIRDIEWVVFDEVHYVNDAERGVVWEEVIIMLPQRINMIFLSATTPNTIEFCDWIGRTKLRPVFVTSTSARPVPLQHYLLHDDRYHRMMHAESGYQPTALQAAVKIQKDKLKPKQASAANAAMKAQRQGEKAAVLAQNAGRKIAHNPGQNQSRPQAGGHGGLANRASSGTKEQWLSLIRVLRGGGRPCAGGHSAVDFNIGLTRHEVEKARRIAKSQMEKYERLPAEIRAEVSKKEYEQTYIRSREDEPDKLEELSLLPAVIFCFSKKKCEEIADFLSQQDFLMAADKRIVGAVLAQMRSRLSPADAQLPQVLRIEEMVHRGVGVHTGGLLPILKEAVEVLFSRGLIKVLVATETFAMGVNMPAKCVVFNGFRKHDGKGFRDLTPGEYTQIAGRAGRRGLDKVGTVVVAMWGDLPGEAQLKTLLTGTATRLTSRFRLTYGMIVNLLRSSDLSIEEMMRRSFSEFHTQRAISGLNITEQVGESKAKLESLAALKAVLNSELPNETGINVDSCYQNLAEAQSHLATLTAQMRRSYPSRLANLFCPGRLVWVLAPSLSHASTAERVLREGGTCAEGPSPAVILTPPAVMKYASDETFSAYFLIISDLSSSTEVDTDCIRVESLPVSCVAVVTTRVLEVPTVRVNTKQVVDVPEDFTDKSKMEKVLLGSAEYISGVRGSLERGQQPNGGKEGGNGFLSSLNVVESCGMSSLDSMEVNILHIEACKRLDFSLPCVYFNSDLRRHFSLSATIGGLTSNVESLQHYASIKSLALFPDFGNRLRVLKSLGYVDASQNSVLLKGRVACEINTCNELLMTEMIFNNVLEPLTPPEAASLLSALVYQEKNDEDRELTTKLEVAKEISKGILDELNELQEAEGVSVDEQTKPTLNFGLAGAVYLWATGAPFSEITEMTLTQEGSIVRCITRLDELLNDCRNAARVIGNASLYRKMDAASLIIRRDIVFATSMYL